MDAPRGMIRRVKGFSSRGVNCDVSLRKLNPSFEMIPVGDSLGRYEDAEANDSRIKPKMQVWAAR